MESRRARTWGLHWRHGILAVTAKLWTCWHLTEIATARLSKVAYWAQSRFTDNFCPSTALVLLYKQMREIARGTTRKELAEALDVVLFPVQRATWT